MTLRVRLALAVAAVGVVLILSGVGLAALVRDADLDELDHQLLAVSTAVAAGAQTLSTIKTPLPPLPSTPPEIPYGELFIGGVGEDGRIVTYLRPAVSSDAVPQVSTAEAAAHTPPPGATAQPFNAPSSRSDATYRVSSVHRPGGGYIIVALPMDRVDATFQRIVLGIVVAGTLVLATLALVAWWVERLGLRPIASITDAAEAIAAGDLDRRVTAGRGRTEAGQLAQAFNVMVDERQAWEEQLRRFVADASHELRTPLTTIVGVMELHRSGSLPPGPALEDALRRADREARRMSALLEDLLLLARLDQGRPLDHDAVDLARLARDVVSDARLARPDRRIRIDVAPVPLVPGDESRLRQVITNLVGNAVTHTGPDAEVRVSVHLDRGAGPEAGGPACVLEVSDDGPGMTPEQARHVFERFYRADGRRGRSRGGAGLGLSIVSSIVAAHGGQVAVETAPGRGATFRVLLPLGPLPTDTIDRPASAPLAFDVRGTRPGPGGGERRPAGRGHHHIPS